MTLVAEHARAVDGAGIVVPRNASGAMTVSLDGQHVWSFLPARDGRPQARGWFVPWPPVLVPYLDGTARVQVVGFDTGRVYVDEEVVLGANTGSARIAVRDRSGNPLSVNKVGSLARAFLATDPATRAEILRGTAAVLSDVSEAGVPAYLNYGALLGAVRDGTMISHDCETDLCYVSEHEQPADVILESYRIERSMRARGWDTVRMSGASFKVLLPLSDGRQEFVDVFAAFFVGGRFFQLGNRSGDLSRDVILPLSTIDLEGVTFPAPADPEAMLAFLYGPGWRVPDPSFCYADPPEGVRRIDGWLRGFRGEQSRWNQWYLAHGGTVPRGRSQFASWVRSRVRQDVLVADLGCGLGRDSVFFAGQGHPVVSLDCAAEARAKTKRRMRERGLPPDVRPLQASELRSVLSAGAELALAERPVVLYARQLLGCLDSEARRNIWRLARMVGGSFFAELSTGEGDTLPREMLHRLDADAVVREATAYGARVLERTDGPGAGMFDQPDEAVTRLHLSFADKRGESHDV